MQKTPNRVTLAELEAKIHVEQYIYPQGIEHFTICVLQMRNGFVVVGTSAPADPENFDADLGRKFARENAVRQLWPLEGYNLCEALYTELDPVDTKIDPVAGTDEEG